MALKIKLSRVGTRSKPDYRIVVAEARSKRDGKVVDSIGTYDPLTSPSTVKVDRKKLESWITKGAKPTPSVRQLLIMSDAKNKVLAKQGP